MRIRSSQIVVAVVVLIGAFFLLVWLRPSNAKVGDNKDFLTEARTLREQGKGSLVTDGLLPSAGEGLTNVPVVDLPAEVFDMGEIANTQSTTKEMPVYNRGEAPLEVTDVRTSCACTVGAFDKNMVRPDGTKVAVIPPGGEAPLKITVDPYRIAGFTARKTLTLFTNDPKKPTVSFDVTSSVLPEYTLDPPDLEFAKVEKGTPAEATILIREVNAPGLEITGVEPGRNVGGTPRAGAKDGAPKKPPAYTLDWVKRPESQWASPEHPEWTVTVHISPDIPEGAFRDTFIIRANTKRVDRVPYDLSANVTSFYSVSPTMLAVRNAVDPGQERIGTAVVSADEPITVEGLSVSGDGLSVSQRPGDKPNTVFIDLSVKPQATPGLKNETISFTAKSGAKSIRHTMRTFASVKG